MDRLRLRASHRRRNRVLAVASQEVDTGAHQELRAVFLGSAEQLADVAFAIPDMDAPRWLPEQLCRLLQVLQPANLSPWLRSALVWDSLSASARWRL